MSSNSNSIERRGTIQKHESHCSPPPPTPPAPEGAVSGSFFSLSAFCLFQIHIIDFDDENNIINKTVLLHQAGEIWHIGASPADKAVLTTCYNKSESHCFLLSPTPLAASPGVMLSYFTLLLFFRLHFGPTSTTTAVLSPAANNPICFKFRAVMCNFPSSGRSIVAALYSRVQQSRRC